MPPAPYQLVKKRCKAGYRRDVKGGTMCNPKPGYTPKVATKKPATPRARRPPSFGPINVRVRDPKTGRFVKQTPNMAMAVYTGLIIEDVD